MGVHSLPLVCYWCFRYGLTFQGTSGENMQVKIGDKVQRWVSWDAIVYSFSQSWWTASGVNSGWLVWWYAWKNIVMGMFLCYNFYNSSSVTRPLRLRCQMEIFNKVSDFFFMNYLVINCFMFWNLIPLVNEWVLSSVKRMVRKISFILPVFPPFLVSTFCIERGFSEPAKNHVTGLFKQSKSWNVSFYRNHSYVL